MSPVAWTSKASTHISIQNPAPSSRTRLRSVAHSTRRIIAPNVRETSPTATSSRDRASSSIRPCLTVRWIRDIGLPPTSLPATFRDLLEGEIRLHKLLHNSTGLGPRVTPWRWGSSSNILSLLAVCSVVAFDSVGGKKSPDQTGGREYTGPLSQARPPEPQTRRPARGQGKRPGSSFPLGNSAHRDEDHRAAKGDGTRPSTWRQGKMTPPHGGHRAGARPPFHRPSICSVGRSTRRGRGGSVHPAAGPRKGRAQLFASACRPGGATQRAPGAGVLRAASSGYLGPVRGIGPPRRRSRGATRSFEQPCLPRGRSRRSGRLSSNTTTRPAGATPTSSSTCSARTTGRSSRSRSRAGGSSA